MSKGFPIPLNAVRAIEIVARRGALAPAAEELGVTLGAVSQHLRRAEARLGMELFERTGQGLVPTAALRAALPQLSAGFAALQDGLAELSGSDEAILNLTVGSVFASRWLIWRINKFTTLYPEIEVRLTVTGAMLDLQRPDIDCGIRFGAGNWPGVIATPIGGAEFQPVCAPPIARALKHPSDLYGVPVIRDETTMLSWDLWLKSVGLDAERRLHGPTYSDPSLAFDAAISEQGVLMAVDMMSADAVSDGRLVRPFTGPVSGPHQYWLATVKGRRETTKLRRFREWLAAEIPASARGYVHQSRG
ncbi:LysR substrate-binding domain-containing protein [Devosia sp. 1635]|uniref:LysR substrate-binding domain-containing protein n=1 Tax=Devosia sp. 1635 TaxID=2726066 RepID=UPI0015660B41|nr:LysR substrate-binding domain-containing protein [Devosia sp. 1635]